MRTPIGRASTTTVAATALSDSDIVLLATPAASQSLAVDAFVESQIGVTFTMLEYHFSANINAA